MDILPLRLHNHYLMTEKRTSPEDVVSHFGAVQAQDVFAAKWAVALRLKTPKDDVVEKAYTDGTILRTHILRPTWHFVMPEDIRWMQELTAHRVKRLMAHYNRKLGFDETLFKKSSRIITTALSNHTYLTRQELKEHLVKAGITTDVQGLGHLMMEAELDGLICSGPKKGKQHTYALLDERVKKHKSLTHEEALGTLALCYITSHGPVLLKDFVWWSGLTAEEAKKAFALLGSAIDTMNVDEKVYYLPKGFKQPVMPDPQALLLSIFDEYTIAYTDRTEISNTREIERMISMGSLLMSVIILNGVVAGSWKREVKKDQVVVTLTPYRELSKKENEALEEEVAKYGTFLGLKATAISAT